MRPPHALIGLAALLAGCATATVPPSSPRPVDVDAVIAAASRANRPVLVLVTDDPTAVRVADARAETVVVDLGISANRPTAARYHVKDADVPVLMTLTPRGLIVGRDGPDVTPEVVRRRVSQAVAESPGLDAEWDRLERPVAARPADAAAQLAVALFLYHRYNDREAIPHLAAVAHDPAVDPPTRVSAWVHLVRAHQWVGEPEQGRHEAQALIATLGDTDPDARAGGMLVLGMQDVTAKRLDRAHDEFTRAVAAAPGSAYAAQARDQLGKMAHQDPTSAPP